MRLISFLILLSSLSVGHATERILSFKSDIQIQKDASLLVTETIQVKAEGDKIKRGIYREFPTHYTDRHGLNFKTTFDVKNVLRDGQPENFHINEKSNGFIVYFGRSDIFLKEGIYTYSLTYKTNRQIGYFDDFDELYWNVTGNGWDFEIESAEATISLPSKLDKFISTAGYTGAQGSKEQDYTQDKKTFKTTRSLHPLEGLTVAVSFPKGLVYQPTQEDVLKEKINDNRLFLISLIFLLLAFLFFYKNWKKVGKDPEKRPIYPEFYPPQNWSPADMRYILKRTIDKKSYGASLINLAVKGWLSIQKTGSEYTLLKDTKTEKDKNTSRADISLFKGLLENTESLLLDNKNYLVIGEALRLFKKKVEGNHTTIYYKSNISYLWKGILLSFISLFLAILGSSSPGAGPLSIWFIVWTIGCFTLFKTYRNSLKQNGFFTNLLFTFFVIPFFAGWGLGILGFLTLGQYALLFITLLIAILNLTFIRLMPAPTIAGQRATELIEGFRLYLETAEKLRLEGLHPPDITPDVFEKYLPYAIALEVENAWAKNFVATLKMADLDPSNLPQLKWINTDISSLTTAVSSVSSGLSSHISSSSYAPGSSSGSSGSGSSGGGGGGGGGGGW
ncbi:MAG: DUF2207 domain-containing protein [Alphaproteobacteria bacterium]|nr:DUF2207 domain-containing protein [Alphaproteobacteria bacterium]